MLIVMGFHATLGKFLIEGRTANFLNMFLGDCRENILWNALYLNNFVHPYNQVRRSGTMMEMVLARSHA